MSRNNASLTLAAFGALAILIALGMWQLQRREWKNALVARFEAGLAEAPRAFQRDLPEFSHARVTGEFLDASTVKLLIPAPEGVRAKTKDGFGYQLFTPMKFQTGIVFVNRGFVPESLIGTPIAAAPRGETEVTGLVRLSQAPGWFTPPPEPAKRVVYEPEIPAMAAAAGLSSGGVIEGAYIQAEPSTPAGEWPLPRDPRELLASIPNRHLEYALTWFGLAATLAGVYAAFMLRR
jgi:surfeit locus 1 family protein